MKALFIADEINQFHWSMLKSVLLILSLLPLSQFFISLWQHTDGSSQIMVGFMAISVFSAISIISFCSALHASVMNKLKGRNIKYFQVHSRNDAYKLCTTEIEDLYKNYKKISFQKNKVDHNTDVVLGF